MQRDAPLDSNLMRSPGNVDLTGERLGEIKVTSIEVKSIEGDPLGISATGVSFNDGRFSAFGETTHTQWQNSWNARFNEATQNNADQPEVANA